MNRRGFLGALATGLVGACVATKIPTAFLPQPVRYRAACEYLLKHYNRYTKGLPIGGGAWPHAMLVGRELYEAFESELVTAELFTSAEDHNFFSLRFKSAKVVTHRLTGLRGWDVMILTRDQWDTARERINAGQSLEWARNAA